MSSPFSPARRRRSFVPVLLASAVLALTACGGDDGEEEDEESSQQQQTQPTTAEEDVELAGTWEHPEEGTIVFEDGGTGSITQSGDPVEFAWQRDGDTVTLTVEGGGAAEATVNADELTFRPGDFSGDDPVTFTRADG